MSQLDDVDCNPNHRGLHGGGDFYLDCLPGTHTLSLYNLGPETKMFIPSGASQTYYRGNSIIHEQPGYRVGPPRKTYYHRLTFVAEPGGDYGLTRTGPYKTPARLNLQISRMADGKPVPDSVKPPASDPRWTLDLTGVTMTNLPAAGRLNGYAFSPDEALLWNGDLALSQGPGCQLGVRIRLPSRRPAHYAGQTFHCEANQRDVLPVLVDARDPEGRPVTQRIKEGYALRLEFGPCTDYRIRGRLYLCLPDEAKSFVAGTFAAQVPLLY
jgi:hypothetical protein